LNPKYGADISTVVSLGTNIELGLGLWKTVEKQENAAGLCSGCAGDYEDPDLTAWEDDSREDEDHEHVEDGATPSKPSGKLTRSAQAITAVPLSLSTFCYSESK
jgi:hypothetical protein